MVSIAAVVTYCTHCVCAIGSESRKGCWAIASALKSECISCSGEVPLMRSFWSADTWTVGQLLSCWSPTSQRRKMNVVGPLLGRMLLEFLHSKMYNTKKCEMISSYWQQMDVTCCMREKTGNLHILIGHCKQSPEPVSNPILAKQNESMLTGSFSQRKAVVNSVTSWRFWPSELFHSVD